MQMDLSSLAAIASANSPVGSTSLASPTSIRSSGAAPEATPFSDLLASSVNEVNGLEDQARAAVTGLITGSGVDIHQAMIATQKASMAFELSLAVRNKAVQAYQQVMSMQF